MTDFLDPLRSLLKARTRGVDLFAPLEALLKAATHKYKSRKKVKGKWVYEYGERGGTTAQLGFDFDQRKRPRPEKKVASAIVTADSHSMPTDIPDRMIVTQKSPRFGISPEGEDLVFRNVPPGGDSVLRGNGAYRVAAGWALPAAAAAVAARVYENLAPRARAAQVIAAGRGVRPAWYDPDHPVALGALGGVFDAGSGIWYMPSDAALDAALEVRGMRPTARPQKPVQERPRRPQKPLQEPQRRPTSRQLDYASSLLARVSSRDWYDSDAGQGMDKPTRADLAAWDRAAVSALIGDLRANVR